MCRTGCARAYHLLGDRQVDADHPVFEELNLSGSEQPSDTASERGIEKGSRSLSMLLHRKRLLSSNKHRNVHQPLRKPVLKRRNELLLMSVYFGGRSVADERNAFSSGGKLVDGATQGIDPARKQHNFISLKGRPIVGV